LVSVNLVEKASQLLLEVLAQRHLTLNLGQVSGNRLA
jgi:hypothetical protein